MEWLAYCLGGSMASHVVCYLTSATSSTLDRSAIPFNGLSKSHNLASIALPIHICLLRALNALQNLIA